MAEVQTNASPTPGILNRVAATARSTYDAAPDLGISSSVGAVAGKLGFGGQGGQEGEEGSGESGGARAQSGDQGARRSSTQEDEPHPLHRGQPQDKVGTESGIPTTSGYGTTISEDTDVQRAASRSSPPKQAQTVKEGGEYRDVACPEGAQEGMRAQEEARRARTESRARAEANGGAKPQQVTDYKTHKGVADLESGSSSGGGLKDKLAGNVKVLKGAVKRDEALKEEGRERKRGGA